MRQSVSLHSDPIQMVQDYTASDGGGWTPVGIRQEITPQLYYEQFVRRWLSNERYRSIIGALGGCCGFEPLHIECMAVNLRREFPKLMESTEIKSKL